MGSGPPVYCEGYATGLSVRAAITAAKIRRSVVVCFTAHNMTVIAQEFGPGFVIADNDPKLAGEIAAKKTGLPYWVSDKVGEDFNDYHQRVGLFAASQAIKMALMKR